MIFFRKIFNFSGWFFSRNFTPCFSEKHRDFMNWVLYWKIFTCFFTVFFLFSPSFICRLVFKVWNKARKSSWIYHAFRFLHGQNSDEHSAGTFLIFTTTFAFKKYTPFFTKKIPHNFDFWRWIFLLIFRRWKHHANLKYNLLNYPVIFSMSRQEIIHGESTATFIIH